MLVDFCREAQDDLLSPCVSLPVQVVHLPPRLHTFNRRSADVFPEICSGRVVRFCLAEKLCVHVHTKSRCLNWYFEKILLVCRKFSGVSRVCVFIFHRSMSTTTVDPSFSAASGIRYFPRESCSCGDAHTSNGDIEGSIPPVFTL